MRLSHWFAVTNFKNKNYLLSTVQLHNCTDSWSVVHPVPRNKLLITHSTLISCYRDLNQFEKALEHCEQAKQYVCKSADLEKINLKETTIKDCLAGKSILSM